MHPIGRRAVSWITSICISLARSVSCRASPVKVIHDSSAVHNFANKVLQAIPRNFGLIILMSFRQVCVQYLHTHSKVGIVKVVDDVPTNFVVLSPLLHDGMEEGENEHQTWKCLMRAFSYRRRGNLMVSRSQVQL